MPLYPAVQAFLVSLPHSCQMIQSAASIHRSARWYSSGSSSSSCSALANCHSEEILPPYRPIHFSARSCATALIRSACGWAAWCFHSLG